MLVRHCSRLWVTAVKIKVPVQRAHVLVMREADHVQTTAAGLVVGKPQWKYRDAQP